MTCRNMCLHNIRILHIQRDVRVLLGIKKVLGVCSAFNHRKTTFT